MTSLRIADIVEDSVVDGPGLRCAVFVQGCSHRCAGCHNPGSWDPAGGREVPVGRIVDLLRRNPLCSGLSLTGGEPTEQAGPCAELAERARALDKDVWCWSGSTWERLAARARREPDLARLLGAVDVLVDGPYLESRRTLSLPWRGSSNQRLVDPVTGIPCPDPLPEDGPRATHERLR